MARDIKKPTPNQQAWAKEISRLKTFKRRAEKRGYIFSEDFIPEKPKRITKKAIEKLRLRTPAVNYEKALYLEPQTGEAISGTERRRQERKAAATKGQLTRRQRLARPEKIAQVSIRDLITSLMGGMPDIRWVAGRRPVDVRGKADRVKMIFLLEWEKRDEDGGLAEYIDYLSGHENEIATLINSITYFDSSETTINASFAHLTQLLLGRSISFSEAEEMEKDYEMYDGG